MRIQKIEKEQFNDYVYNLELKSKSEADDLFWIEGNSGIVTHNCFPKDMNAILFIADQNQIRVPTLMGADLTNRLNRTNRDWEQMEGRAVSTREEVPSNVIGLERPTFWYNKEDPTQVVYGDDAYRDSANTKWIPQEVFTFKNGELLQEPKENEIIYRYTPDRGYILKIELETETVVDHKFVD